MQAQYELSSQIAPPEQGKDSIFMFWEKTLDQVVFLPDTPEQRTHANRTMMLNADIVQCLESFTQDTIRQLNDLVLDPTAPTVSLLSISQTIGHLREHGFTDPQLELILSHITTIVSGESPYQVSSQNISSNRTTALAMLTVASVFNALGEDTPERKETPAEVQNSLYLRTAAEVLRNKRLEINLPVIISTTLNSDEEYEFEEGFPKSQIILPPGHLADWEKMRRACIWGVPIDGNFFRRLPGAIICLETEKRINGLQTDGKIRRRSKFNYVRIPSIMKQGENIQNIYSDHTLWNDESLVDSHAISSLSYFLALRARKQIDAYEPDRVVRKSSLMNVYSTKGDLGLVEHYANIALRRVLSPVLHAPARFRDEDEQKVQVHPSILQTAALEFMDETGIALEQDPLLRSLKASIEMTLIRYDAESNSYSMRTEEEINRLFVRQTLRDLALPDLITFAKKYFSEYPDTKVYPGHLNPDEENEIASQYDTVATVLASLSTNPPSNPQEIEGYERMLQTFLEPILEVRFRTVRDTGRIEQYPKE